MLAALRFAERILVSGALRVRQGVKSISIAWPLFFFTPVLAILLLWTQQGRQGLNAVLTEESPQFWMTFLALGAHSVLVNGYFLQATRRRMELFGRAVRLQRFNRHVALALSLLMPAFVTVYIGYLLLGSSDDSTRIRKEALTVSLVTLAFVSILNYWMSRQLFSIRETAYNQVGLISKRYRRLILALVISILAVGLLTTLNSCVRDVLGPAAIAILAMTMIGFALTWFVGVIYDRQLPPFMFWLLLSAIAAAMSSLGFGSNYHNVRLIKSDAPDAFASSDNYARKWIESRIALDPSGDSRIPAVFVIAEGGGIYAARNAAGVLADLDRRSGGEFYNSVFSLSGVSGGSVGLATYLSARAERLTDGEKGAQAIHDTLGEDYLSPLAAGLFFRDLLLRITPLTLIADAAGVKGWDRASIFENDYARHWIDACERQVERECADRFASPFLNMVENAKPVACGAAPCPPGPIVMFNTVNVDTGKVEVISNIDFDRSDKAQSNHALQNVLADLKAGETISLGSAAHMSARFPMISPTAMLPPERRLTFKERVDAFRGKEIMNYRGRKRYVDGGYVDNSGAYSSVHALDELVAAARRLDANCEAERCVSDRLVPIVLHIYVRRVDNSAERNGQRAGTNWFEEFVNPLSAVLKVRSARGGDALENFCRTLAFFAAADPEKSCFRIEKNEQKIQESGSPILSPSFDGDGAREAVWIAAPVDVGNDPRTEDYVPLGWYLGDTNDYLRDQQEKGAGRVCEMLARAVASERWTCGDFQ